MGVSARKEREQEAKKQLILNAAYLLFKEKGFDSATVDEIAFRAEIGKGTVYSYFKSKDEIYMTIINSELDTLIEKLKKASDISAPASARLENIFDTYVSFYREYSGLIGKFLGKGEHNKTNLRISDLITGLKARAEERSSLVSSIMSAGVAAGEFRDIDIIKTTKIFLSLMIGLITATEADQITELEEYRDNVFDIFLNGIRR